MASRSASFSTGAGYVILVAREVSGLSLRKLAGRMNTSQPTLAKLETGSRMPTVRTSSAWPRRPDSTWFWDSAILMRTLPCPVSWPTFVLLGALRLDPRDGLADFVVIREPGPFVGPTD